MTNKEAIMILESIQPSCGEKYSFSESEIYEAIDMAIEALNHSEIPNSSDCIDRAEAQTAIQFAARRYTVAHEAHGEGHVVWSDNLISVTDAMNALREVPSAHSDVSDTNVEDTISRQDAIEALHDEIVRRRINEDSNDDGTLDEFDTEAILRRLPPAQHERDKGKWIHISDGYVDIYECNQCGETEDYERNFCPSCGADMIQMENRNV